MKPHAVRWTYRRAGRHHSTEAEPEQRREWVQPHSSLRRDGPDAESGGGKQAERREQVEPHSSLRSERGAGGVGDGVESGYNHTQDFCSVGVSVRRTRQRPGDEEVGY